jgi:FtsP/CotA-like multicopper oxidase with cupredoxin domain
VSRTQRLALLAVAVVIAIAAAVIIGTGGSDSTESAGPTTIEVKDAKPVGGIKTLTYKKGDTIDITIKSDTADEVHFHGYDVHKDVDAGGSVRFSLPATIEGEFVMELEDHKQTLVNVKVEPS